jgi:CheY-like chemotaxis protein
VLVVDDSQDIADLLCIALNAEGFEAVAEYDGRAALARWRTFRPHAAVFDLGMPGIDGYELARTIRKEYGATPTLIAATGYGQPEDRKRAIEAGFDVHVVKPASIDDLIRILDDRSVGRPSPLPANDPHG